MADKVNFLKGVIYALGTLISVSVQPIITLKRSMEVDPMLYAIFTVFFEAVFIIPIMIPQIVRRTNKVGAVKEGAVMEGAVKEGAQGLRDEIRDLNNGEDKGRGLWKFFIIGGIFALAQYLFYVGFDRTDAITGSIAVKSTIVFTLIGGFLFLNEKVTGLQVILTGVILITLVYVISEGTFSVLKINIGTLILVLVPLLWTAGHSITKPLLRRGVVMPSEVIFFRTLVSFILLITIYISYKPVSDILIIFKSANLINVMVIAMTYLVAHYCWYLSISNIDLALSSAIQSPQPIITSIFAAIFLREGIKFYQVIGLIIITSSIILILRDKNKVNKRDEQEERRGKGK
ncbi:MAG: EamA family transporter [Promethearchaeota archaeon]